MQVQTFRKVHGYGYASTMCIGNLRSGTESLSIYLRDKRPEALRKAHNLKGVCGSLGLTKLQGQLAALVKLLRSEGFTAEQVAGQLHDIRPEWERTLDCIRQLEA